MAFQCTVVTPEQQVLDERVQQVILPAHDGLVGIRTDRAPMLAKLGLGPLRVDLASGQRRFYFIEGGVAQMKDNRLTLLTQEATPADEISPEVARAAYAEAAAQAAPDAKSAAAKHKAMERARAMQAMAALGRR